MSARVKRNLSLLKQLLHSSPSQRRVIIKSASKDLILTLCEIAVNILKGKVPLNPMQFQKLKKKRAGIRLFADKKSGSIEEKKETVESVWRISLTPFEYRCTFYNESHYLKTALDGACPENVSCTSTTTQSFKKTVHTRVYSRDCRK